MAYYVSNLFGIRTGGVFSGKTDMKDFRRRVSSLIEMMKQDGLEVDLYSGPKRLGAMSAELAAHKGFYVVIAGVFNYWTYEHSSEFAKRLSAEFQTEVMHMCWDEEVNSVQCQIWLAGKPLFEIEENPIGQVLRRIT